MSAPLPDTSTVDPALADNPLATPSTLPYGLPAFAAIRPEHFGPAFAAGIAETRALLEQVAADPTAPTFATVIEPLERGSALLDRTQHVFFHIVASDGSEELRAIEAAVTPELTALEDAMYLDAPLFARIDALHQAASDGTGEDLTAEQAHVLSQWHQRFVLHGARLEEDGRTALASLNQEISARETAFTQDVLHDLTAAAVHVTEEAELDGLDDAQRAAARAAAQEAGLDGFLLTLVLPTVQPLLTSLTRRDVRERLHRASIDRGTETWGLAAEIAQLRARRAALLGFEDFASLAVADRTAQIPLAVDDLFDRTIAPAMRRTAAEAERIARRAAEDGIQQLEAWDWPFYADRVRAEDHAVDQKALQPYFVLERVLFEGVFRAARDVYGVTLELRKDLRAHHPDAVVWEVKEADGTGLGLFIGDYFTRDTKRGGAWMNPVVTPSGLLGTRAVVSNNLNIARPAHGGIAYVTLDEVRTMFHEFGHALHGLVSAARYPSVSGTSVPRDIVEYPSQVNEMWALRPGIVEHYARHIETDEPIPADLLARVQESALWGEGRATVEYLAAAVLDWRWHAMGPDVAIDDARAFEDETLEDAGLAHPLVPPRYRTGYFQHTFSGSYASGYYSYLWAEAFDADTVAWFDEQTAAGVPVREAGEAFRRGFLELGGSRDLLAAYQAFRGHDRDLAHLLARRGLADADAPGLEADDVTPEPAELD